MKKKKSTILAGFLSCTLLLSGCGETNSAPAAETQPAAEVQTQETDLAAAKLIEDIATVQAFTDEAVTDEAIEAIVSAGVNAPSAMNGQPWHFTVVTDRELLEEIAGDMKMPAGMPSGERPEGMPQMPSGERPEGMPEMPSGEKPEGMPEMPSGERPEGMPQMPSGERPEGIPEMPSGMPSGGAKAGIADAPLVIIVSCREGSELDAGLATQNMSVEAQLLGYGTKLISSPKLALNGSRQEEYRELLEIPDDMSAVCMLLIGKTDTEQYDVVTGATERNPSTAVVTYK